MKGFKKWLTGVDKLAAALVAAAVATATVLAALTGVAVQVADQVECVADALTDLQAEVGKPCASSSNKAVPRLLPSE